MFGSGTMTTLLTSNEKMDDITKTVKSLKNAGLLIKVLANWLKIKQKNKGTDFSACYLVH